MGIFWKVDEDGNILEVRNDNDRNIYLVHDVSNWNGTKDNLEIVGHTATPRSLKNHVGKCIYSEEVANFIFAEAEQKKKMQSIGGAIH